MYNYIHPKNKRHMPMISQETFDIVTKNAEVSLKIYYMYN